MSLRLKHKIIANTGGVWGDEPDGIRDTFVLRSTDQTVDGGWRIVDPAVRSIDPSDASNYRLELGDILVTKSSGSDLHIGKASLVTKDVADLRAAFSNFNQRIRVSKRQEARFYWYFLNSNQARYHYVVRANSTSGLGNLTASILGDLPIPDTALKDQIAIANFLERETARIDRLIERRERFLNLISEKKSALVELAVNGNILNVPPDGEQGWFGRLPSNWPVRRAKFLFRERQTRSLNGDEELLTVSHITGVTKRSEKDVNMFMAESMAGYKLVSSGDVVINTMWAWMGAMGVSSIEGLISPSYGVYFPTSGAFEPGYIDLLLRSRPFIAEATRRSKGIHSSRLRLYPDAFLDIVLPVPSLDAQGAILTALRVVTEREEKLAVLSRRSLNLLREFRSSLITTAVAGRIDVMTWSKRGTVNRRAEIIEAEAMS